MDVLKAQFDRLQKQLSGLTASQRMLTGALVAIMVITLVWWGRYAGEAEMEPLLNQSFSQEDVTRITTDLASKGIRYSVSGDRILIPSERRFEVLASLGYAHLLPRDTKVGFDEMIKQMSPWQPEKTTDAMFNRGKEMTLAQIIQKFPRVEHADVMIDPTHERHIEGSVEPSAVVTITMLNNDPAGQQLVDAAADVVQGAQSGLSRSKIKVVVGGVHRRVRDPQGEDGFGTDGNDQLELKQKNELMLANKLREYLSYIPELKVAVTVKLNTTSVQEQSKTYDAKGALQKETESTSETEETNTPSAAASEPGFVPNASLAIPTAAAPAPVATQNHEKSSNKFQNYVPEVSKVSKTPAGDALVVAATVRVPTSYFAGIYLRQNPSAKDQTVADAQLRPLIDSELPKIRKDVLKCYDLKSENDVAVETYSDAMPVFAAAPVTATAGLSSVSLMIGGHTKELVLGAMAVMSLFMVSMMVKKGTPVLAAPIVVAPAGPPPILEAGERIAGEAGDGGAMLDGMELDEGAVRTQQMLDQVSTMVKENPDAAANLVKRWLNRT